MYIGKNTMKALIIAKKDYSKNMPFHSNYGKERNTAANMDITQNWSDIYKRKVFKYRIYTCLYV